MVSWCSSLQTQGGGVSFYHVLIAYWRIAVSLIGINDRGVSFPNRHVVAHTPRRIGISENRRKRDSRFVSQRLAFKGGLNRRSETKVTETENHNKRKGLGATPVQAKIPTSLVAWMLGKPPRRGVPIFFLCHTAMCNNLISPGRGLSRATVGNLRSDGCGIEEREESTDTVVDDLVVTTWEDPE